MKNIFVILLIFAIFTIYHYEVDGIGNNIMRSTYLVKTVINDELVSLSDNGIFLYKDEEINKKVWRRIWYKFIPYSQIVSIEKKTK